FKVPAVVPIIGGVAVLVLTSAVLINPQTAEHDHGGAGHSHSDAAASVTPVANRCDYDLNPASFWREAHLSGRDGGAPAAPAAAASPAGHSHDGSAAAGSPSTSTTLGPLQGRGSEQLDKIMRLNADGGEAAAGIAVAELANTTPEEYDEF